MYERLSLPQGAPSDILLVRRVHVGRMREEQPAVGQPTQDTIPGAGSSDTD